MNLFVETSVWSVMLRRDQPTGVPQVRALVRALEGGERVVTTGVVLQELLQGFSTPKAQSQIVERFGAFPLLVPHREDHVEAAALRGLCRKRGVQIGTIDALLARLCIQHELMMLTTDDSFMHVAQFCPLKLWEF